MATVCPAARSASSTVETWPDTLLERSTAIGLPAPEPADEPTTTVEAQAVPGELQDPTEVAETEEEPKEE